MRAILPVFSALMLAGIAAPAFAQAVDATPPSITVQGLGEVRAAPDMAMIMTGVTTQGETAREALDSNSTAMEQLLETLVAAGVAERDIQTSNFAVNPIYVYSDQVDADGYTRPPRIQGYEVSNTVTIVVRDLDQLGTTLDEAVSVGANTINGISFALDDTSAALEEARRLSVEDAMAKAEVYADAAGLALGDLVRISEGVDAYPPQPYARAEMASFAGDSSVPIQGGELSFSVTTSITWSLAAE